MSGTVRGGRGLSLAASTRCVSANLFRIGFQPGNDGIDSFVTDLRTELVAVVLHVGDAFDPHVEGAPAVRGLM